MASKISTMPNAAPKFLRLTDFATAAIKGESISPTFRDGLATDYVTDAVLKSAKSGKWESARG